MTDGGVKERPETGARDNTSEAAGSGMDADARDWLDLAALHSARDDLEQDALRRLTRKAFLGSLASGAAAGALGAWEAGSPVLGTVAMAFFGALCVLIGGFCGGLAGALCRAFVEYLRHGQATESGDACLEGTIIGGFAGAYLALLGCLALWSLPWAHLAAGLGAMAGAFLGALPGRMVGTLMAMLAVAEMDDPEPIPEPADLAVVEENRETSPIQ